MRVTGTLLTVLIVSLLETTSHAFSLAPSLAATKWTTTLASRNAKTKFFAGTEEKSGIFSEDIQQEAREVLEKVGWARPMQGEGEMTSDDPFVQQINAGIQRDFGVDLDDLLNPAKVRELLLLVHCLSTMGFFWVSLLRPVE